MMSICSWRVHSFRCDMALGASAMPRDGFRKKVRRGGSDAARAALRSDPPKKKESLTGRLVTTQKPGPSRSWAPRAGKKRQPAPRQGENTDAETAHVFGSDRSSPSRSDSRPSAGSNAEGSVGSCSWVEGDQREDRSSRQVVWSRGCASERGERSALSPRAAT